MRHLTLLGLCCAALLGGPAAAQDAHKAQAAQGTAPTATSKLDDLIKRYQKQQSDVSAAYQKATTDEERARVLKGLPGAEYIPEFRALAVEAQGTETAAKAWLWVLRLSGDDRDSAWGAMEALLEQHMQSPSMAELADNLRYAAQRHGEAKVTEALRAIVDECPHEKARAAALFALGAVLMESKNAANEKEGRNCFEAVVTEYGEVATRSTTYKAMAEGFLFELDRLQLGMEVPDFESIDENGVKWRLSDYRGKVVVVDFWGYW